MKLDLDIRPGRRPEPLRAEVLRELAVEDVALLHAARGTEPPEIKKVSERHHALARAIASGLSNAEAAAAVGYDPARVSILKNSPAFQELLDLYRSQADAEFAELQGRLAGLSKQAVLELMDRLETDPESISVGQLLEMVKTGADRTGHGPSSKQETTLNINLADRLEAARKRALEAQMIDVTPEDQA